MAYRVGRGGPNGGGLGERRSTLSLKNKRRYERASKRLQSQSLDETLQLQHFYPQPRHPIHHPLQHQHQHQHQHHLRQDRYNDYDHDHHLPKRVKGNHLSPPPPPPPPLLPEYDGPLHHQKQHPQQPQYNASAAPVTPRPPSPLDMERTESGLSISSETGDYIDPADEQAEDLLSDDEAARRVTSHILHGGIRPDTQSERILRSLVNPRHDYRLDDSALLSLFWAANELFFLKALDRRVAWDWSHSSSEQYARHIVGTTALRRSATQGGYETLIVLSTPILKDTSFNRRLLISTFLHEMIHSYLFVMCGLKAKEDGGHTPGFRKIATAIDDWVGKDYLHLRDMEADLERYRGPVTSAAAPPPHKCSDHQAAAAAAAYPATVLPPAVYPPEEDEPYRTRSPASHPNWHWGHREDFGAPRHTRMQQADDGTAPAAYTSAATSSPSIATYVPPSYHTYHPQRYAGEQQQQQQHHQHYMPPVHHYHRH